MSQKRLFMISSALLICVALFPELAAGQPRPMKKVIEYGWDVPYPDFVEQNMQEMEKRPFEGIIFLTKGFDHAFDTGVWKQEELQPQLDTLAKIKWRKFTDNFLTLYAANKGGMNWFNDDIGETLKII